METAMLASSHTTTVVQTEFEPCESVELGGMTARSSVMQQTLTVLKRLAQTDMTVTLMGETGSGKDVLAHALHRASTRSRENFVVLDCGSVVPNLAESELLGHERGAFTGAIAQYIGAFERAHGGTLFIDEVGELPLELQTRLLRVLESRRIRRVGGSQDRTVDVRVIASTHRELALDVAAGRFRQDLYFRLAAAVVRVPSLRDRREDLPVLVEQLLEELHRPEVQVASGVWDWMAARGWPGNVRELKNALVCGCPASSKRRSNKRLRKTAATRCKPLASSASPCLRCTKSSSVTTSHELFGAIPSCCDTWHFAPLFRQLACEKSWHRTTQACVLPRGLASRRHDRSDEKSMQTARSNI
jgi:transcriptional regulator with GAF, ATPase, and Fis domain